MCDFEFGLMKAHRDEFIRDDDGAVNGCNFHWKQACRRKMAELRIPDEVITKLIGKDGLMNFLEVIKYDDIPRAIIYIRSKAEEGVYEKNLISFGPTSRGHG